MKVCPSCHAAGVFFTAPVQRTEMAQGLILSPTQQQVVGHRASDLQVLACAGSGKMESISRRVAALIAEGAAPASDERTAARGRRACL